MLLSTKYLRKAMAHGKNTVVSKLLPRYIGPLSASLALRPAAWMLRGCGFAQFSMCLC